LPFRGRNAAEAIKPARQLSMIICELVQNRRTASKIRTSRQRAVQSDHSHS